MFNIGDEVVIINDRDYNITRKGSKGIIVRTFGTSADVKFTFIAGNRTNFVGDEFCINNNHMELIIRKTKEERILDKIKVMEQRYVHRHRSGQPVKVC